MSGTIDIRDTIGALMLESGARAEFLLLYGREPSDEEFRDFVVKFKSASDAGAFRVCDEHNDGQTSRLLAAIEKALEDLECADLKCWCFTRAAMERAGREPCACANCGVWRLLNEVAP